MGSQRFNISAGRNLRLLLDYKDAQTDFIIHCKHMPTCTLRWTPAHFKNVVSYVNIQKIAATGDFQQCFMCSQQRLRSACAYVQSGQRLCYSLQYFMTLRLLTDHHFEFLRLKGGCTGLSESTFVKMTHCWKSHVPAQL